MVKKKIDNRIRVMIENGVKLRHRTMFLLVGDKSRDQVPILYDMLVKSTVKARPTVLWCYKNKDEAISNHGRKRAKKIAAGKLEVSEESLFDSFRVATTIHGRYYSETHAILGHTYGVCVLQDFEALTPNLMARTIETVEGGGLIIFLLKSMDSLRQLHSMTMDVHARFKTEAYGSVANRFNERFLLSLTDHPRCLVLDDALTVLPISSKTSHVEPVSSAPETVNPQLSSLIDSLSDSPPAGPLVALCRTYDQATALATIIDTLADKQARPPHCLTAARGRGKSACLGLGVAAAVALGYVNVYVTSPHPENMATLFQFALRGLDALLYQEHTDYNIVRSTNPDFRKAIVRIDIARNSRQTIQYITPDDHSLLGAADLVLVDEAAAIPLGLVREAVQRAPLALLASTVAGYEGTGRALTLKLFTQLQTKHNAPPPLKLEEPIRYGAGDGVEAWLNGLLCLEATVGASAGGAPPPASCSLYRVDRDALFCYHRAADAFLHRLVAVLVASHYKNSPNDLQLMADAPAHNLFVLLPPSPPHCTALPDILCVVQLCMEGNISDKFVRESVGRGRKAAGDLVPWNVCEQYGDAAFPQLCGARIVRIATHPSYQRMGYGKRALQQLIAYYSGEMASLEETEVQDGVPEERLESAVEGGGLREERIVPRARPPPLLRRLHEMAPEELHYIGTSFGLTEELIKFWKSQKFVPIYLSQKSNDITGEHSCILIRCLSSDNTWLPAYHADFRVRLSRLLPRALRSLPATLALATLNNQHVKLELTELTRSVVDTHLTGHDVARLERYCRQQVEHSLVADLFATLAHLYFHTRHSIKLDAVQQVILVAMGFQVKEVEAVSQELGLPASQVLARLYEGCRRILAALLAALERDAAAALGLNESNPMSTTIDTIPALQSLPEEMDAAAKELERKQRKELSRLMGEDLQQYSIKGSETDWSQAVAHSKHSNLISVKSGEKRLGDDTKELDNLINANPKKKLKKKHNRHK